MSIRQSELNWRNKTENNFTACSVIVLCFWALQCSRDCTFVALSSSLLPWLAIIPYIIIVQRLSLCLKIDVLYFDKFPGVTNGGNDFFFLQSKRGVGFGCVLAVNLKEIKCCTPVGWSLILNINSKYNYVVLPSGGFCSVLRGASHDLGPWHLNCHLFLNELPTHTYIRSHTFFCLFHCFSPLGSCLTNSLAMPPSILHNPMFGNTCVIVHYALPLS